MTKKLEDIKDLNDLMSFIHNEKEETYKLIDKYNDFVLKYRARNYNKKESTRNAIKDMKKYLRK